VCCTLLQQLLQVSRHTCVCIGACVCVCICVLQDLLHVSGHMLHHTTSRHILHHTTLIDLCVTRPFTSVEAHVATHHIEPHVATHHIEAHVTPYHTRFLYHYTTRVAVCCSMMQRVARVALYITRSLQRACCSVVLCVAVCCRVLLCVAVCYRVLQSVAVCCSVV